MAATAVSRARELLWRAAEASALNALVRRRGAARLLIVCYHGVCADDSPVDHWLLVRRRSFARQLDYLQRCFRIQALDEALVALRMGQLHEPTAVITFDDGYRNNLTVAFPELRARGVPATIFLATGLISTSRTLWTTALEHSVHGTSEVVLDLRRWSGPCLPLRSPAERGAAAHAAKELLKTLPAVRRRPIVDALISTLGPADVPAEFAFMTWEEIHEMARTGLIRFGAHTVNHEILSGLDDGALEHEITESVGGLASLGDAASRVFAYPNGRPRDFDARAVRMLEASGVIGAVTTIPGVNTRGIDPFLLRRLVVDEAMSPARFAAEAGGALSLVRAWGGAPRARGGVEERPLRHGRE